MQYHALALASHLAEVDLVGRAGSVPHRAVREHPHIHWHWLGASRPVVGDPQAGKLSLGYAVLQVVRECLQLFWLLLWVVPPPDIVLVQNPPAIPTLLSALVVARLRAARLVIDWHNFAYTVLALRFGAQHLIVRLAQWYERTLGRHADAHFCVSRAMQAELAQHWGISNAIVLYDQPAEYFAPTPLQVRHELFQRLQDVLACPAVLSGPETAERPAIIVSATSWTADEDFALLLEAVQQCDAMIHSREHASPGRPFPHLLFLITGQGPWRAHYETQMARLALHKIHLRTLWLAAEDYPLLLGAADLGLCLHRSSSGLDLPMKLADMFGAGLPVCALDYGPCLTEQIQHGDNGLLFSTSAELASQLYDLLQGFPDHTPGLDRLRQNVRRRSCQRWSDGWRETAQQVFATL
jgi:beta-1,4-mannosyltransferase